MLIEYDTFAIAEHWVCAIDNGDITGLSDEEEKNLQQFLDSLPSGCWSWSDSAEFSRDAVSGLMANCLEARLWVSQSAI